MKKITFLFAILISLCSYSQDTTSNGRCLPQPFPLPPLPMTDWCGSPVIGEPASEPDYLTQAIEKATKKTDTKWATYGIKIMGWVDVGINGSTSKITNSPAPYDFIPNQLVLDQAVVQICKDPDMVQTKHVDWGFQITGMYGIDYRYIIAKGEGLMSNRLFNKNKIYGGDLTQYNFQVYIPQIAQGMFIRVGRYISPSDIEAQWAPQNYLYSHSIMFSVDPYTYTGIQSTIRLHKQFQFEFGIHAGNDVAPWSNSAHINGSLMLRWVSKDNNESLYGGLGSIGSGQFKNGHDDLQQFVLVWGHRFNKTFHMMTEAYYMWQFNAATGGTAIYAPVAYGQGGGLGTTIPGRSESIGIVNYTQALLSSKDYLSLRNEALNDVQGQRTGYATWYTATTIGWCHHFTDYIMIRPEARYDHSWNNSGVTPFDGGIRNYQFIAGMDLCVSF